MNDAGGRDDDAQVGTTVPPPPPPPKPSRLRRVLRRPSKAQIVTGAAIVALAGGLAGAGVYALNKSTEVDDLRAELRRTQEHLDTTRDTRDQWQEQAEAAEQSLQEMETEREEAEAELEERSQELETRSEELDERAAELDERESAVTETEEQIAANTVTDGVWTVGVDIEPGTYRATDVSSDCYWAILVSGTNGSDIVENDIPGGGSPQVTVEEGQDFNSRRCGEWVRQ